MLIISIFLIVLKSTLVIITLVMITMIVIIVIIVFIINNHNHSCDYFDYNHVP